MRDPNPHPYPQPLPPTPNPNPNQAEMRDLLTDLKNIPKNAAIRKVNELVKRVRLAKAHMCIVGHLKKEMPAVFGRAARTPEPPDPNPSRGSRTLARNLDSITLSLTLPLDPSLSHPQLAHPRPPPRPRPTR